MVEELLENSLRRAEAVAHRSDRPVGGTLVFASIMEDFKSR